MAAVVQNSHAITTPEIDVFTLPHSKMRQLIIDSTEEVTSTNFGDMASMQVLLQQLSSTLIQFRLHEEIEDKYIMRVLKKRLTGGMLKRLIKHLHANSHISDLIKLVKNIQQEVARVTSESKLKSYGEKLHTALEEFYNEYLPHMVDEEKVFQPLLLEYFTYGELISIKERVLRLHFIQESVGVNQQEIEDVLISDFSRTFSIKTEQIEAEKQIYLPSEILLKIFNYLQPREICRCAQVNKLWSSVAMDPELWSILHPSRWGRGDFTFGRRTSSDDCNCDCEPNYTLLQFRDELDDGSSGSSDSDDADSEQIKESNILLGVSRYLLPKVGKGVKTLVLECSKGITNGLLYRILSQCPNLEYLDVSQTIISDIGLNGLFKDGGGKKLKYIDMSGCTGITDKTLLKLSSLYGRTLRAERKAGCPNCTCKMSQPPPQGSAEQRQITAMGDATQRHRASAKLLECLRLSGCYKITDDGLRSLAKQGGLPRLRHLDLSGCFNVSAGALNDLVAMCPRVDAQELYYCDNVMEGPFSDSASGCQNIDCKNRVCCRNSVP
eukprot:gene6214-6930_t